MEGLNRKRGNLRLRIENLKVSVKTVDPLKIVPLLLLISGNVTVSDEAASGKIKGGYQSIT